MRLSHLADGVHRAGGHWQISDRSDLRGGTLQIREGISYVLLPSICLSHSGFKMHPSNLLPCRN